MTKARGEVPPGARRQQAGGTPGGRAADPTDRAAYVAAVFARVAPRYDLINNLMTAWQHRRWRRHALDALGPLPKHVSALDLCCGTGDFLLLLAERIGPEGRLVGVDFCAPMRELAEARLRAAGLAGHARLLEGDVTRLTDLAAESFDVITVGFGLRNVADLDAALREAFRLLRRGGALASLDLSWPARGLPRALGLAYVRHVLPWLARLAGAQTDDYRWLHTSLEQFPDAAGLADRLRGAGFARVDIRRFGCGLVVAHVARKA